MQPVKLISQPSAEHIIIDVRHPDEVIQQPLNVDNQLLCIPFFSLQTQMHTLDTNCAYLLYCNQNLMSRVHAEQLREQGYLNVDVYSPS